MSERDNTFLLTWNVTHSYSPLCGLLFSMSTSSLWPLHISPLILTPHFTGKCLNSYTHTHTRCSVTVSVIRRRCVMPLKFLARPRSWIMLLRNRSVWKCSTDLGCCPVDTEVRSCDYTVNTLNISLDTKYCVFFLFGGKAECNIFQNVASLYQSVFGSALWKQHLCAHTFACMRVWCSAGQARVV